MLDLRLLRDGVHITTHPSLDALFTTLVIVAGAERIRDFIASPGSTGHPREDSKATPIKILIEDGEGKVREIEAGESEASMRSIIIELGEPANGAGGKQKRGGAALVVIIGAAAAVISASLSKPDVPMVVPPLPHSTAQTDGGWQRDSEEPSASPRRARGHASGSRDARRSTAAARVSAAGGRRDSGHTIHSRSQHRRSRRSPSAERRRAARGFIHRATVHRSLQRMRRCAVAVVFDPTLGRNATGTMTILSDAGNAQIHLTGIAPPLPPFELPPIDFDAADHRRRQASRARLRRHESAHDRTHARPRAGRPPFRIREGRLPGTPCCRAVAAATSPSISIRPPPRITPAGLTIAGPDGTLIARASLRGTGTQVAPVAVKLDIEPRRLDFRALLPRAKSITVANPEFPRAVKITGVSISPQVFDLTTDCLDKPLEPNARCQIIVSRRTIVGAAAANIIVSYDGGEETSGSFSTREGEVKRKVGAPSRIRAQSWHYPGSADDNGG